MPPRILVVDDDATIVRLLRVNLQLEGYEVLCASNGKEALETVAAEDLDLVICDVMMPVMDGLQVVHRLKRDPATVELPVVLLSAKAQDVDIRHGRGAGADDYMTKPFDPVDLIALVERIVGKADEQPPKKKAAKKK